MTTLEKRERRISDAVCSHVVLPSPDANGTLMKFSVCCRRRAGTPHYISWHGHEGSAGKKGEPCKETGGFHSPSHLGFTLLYITLNGILDTFSLIVPNTSSTPQAKNSSPKIHGNMSLDFSLRGRE